MRYHLVIADSASEDMDDVDRWIARSSPAAARRWLVGVQQALQTLRQFPRRCPLAPENDIFGQEIRHLLFGQYRVLFTIVEDEVRVLHVRHGARRPLTPEEFDL